MSGPRRDRPRVGAIELGAILRRQQRLDRRGRPRDRIGVRAQQLIHQRLELDPTPPETSHLSVHRGHGSLASDPGGLARLAMLDAPCLGVVVEQRGGAGGGLIRVGLRDVGERRLEGHAGTVVVRGCDRVLGSRTQGGVGSRRQPPAHRERAAESRHEQGRHHRSRALHRVDELPHRGESILGLLGETPREGPPHDRRDLHVARQPRHRGVVEQRRHEVRAVELGVGPAAAQALVERHAPRELVACRTSRLADVALRGEVGRRPRHEARLRRPAGPGQRVDRVRVRFLERPVELRPGDPEVHHPDSTLGAAHRIVGLEVAMHQARRMHGGQPARGVQVGGHDRRGARPRVVDPRAQSLAFDELHRHVETRRVSLPEGVLADLVDGDHVRVGDLRHRPRFRQRPLHGVRGLRPGLEAHELDRDPSIESGIVRREHDPHPAPTDLLEQREPADSGRDRIARRRSALVVRIVRPRMRLTDGVVELHDRINVPRGPSGASARGGGRLHGGCRAAAGRSTVGAPNRSPTGTRW